MDWGLHFPSHIDSWKWVSHAENKGFSYYMPYDSIGSDVYETLALCAFNTKKIKLGPGVTSPRSRIAPVTARAMATLNQIAPGRCVLGIGSGNTARRAWGMPIAKLEEIREEVEILRKMLKGKEAVYTEGPGKYMPEERKRYVKFLSPDWGFINKDDEIPIYIAGSGPKTLELAGEIADGIILLGAIGQSFVDYCMKHLRIGAERAGRNADDLYTIVLTAYHILNEYETLQSESVRQSVGPVAAVCLNIAALSLVNNQSNTGNALGEPLPGDIREEVMQFKDAYPEDEDLMRKHLTLYGNYFLWNQEYASMLTPETIKTSTLVGTADEITDTIRRLESQGINQIMIAPLPDPVKSIDSFHDNIMSRY
ncbi:MAG: LLM class flavin-dependent oxidoreductase [Candidatus Dadabacteria bacterium]|nr:LLM class flavin-dependent oxidoreductase [Candidatus Dadabacteria bacterium]NIS08322.1 LLM class flavin-dependent oxidoreductase [Candidatus Dadabacteria bacterium]NIV41746.1 LLM class flavin-dependent oxidoreductase [Candidatus Dadabacteria bacterium]NIX15194.1 LLM class flavin-dependent oxidoreductase [Candidatus Dadabacteria bacterium]NIY21839.1 LLM class flavin-dependent oxidoreductase [Candidatus Dadabacteria bacterium]